jgi:endonuclease-3
MIYSTPDTLDALVRTILSQNTTNKNSTNAKLAMDERYGRGNYKAVLEDTDEGLAEVIKSGGLAKIKSKVIRKILIRLDQKKDGGGGELSLDYLTKFSDAECMKELGELLVPLLVYTNSHTS